MDQLNPAGQKKSNKTMAIEFTRELNSRLKGRVPYADHADIKTVPELMHRLSGIDVVSKMNFHRYAKKIIAMTGNVIGLGFARDLVAKSIGYADYYHAMKSVKNDKFPNTRTANKLRRSMERAA